LPTKSSDRWRLIRRSAAVLLALVIAVAIGGAPVYVCPQIDTPRHADAIVILGGDHPETYQFGMALASKGVASTVLVSKPVGRADQWVTQRCEHPPPSVTMHCFVPDPATTKGEGREVRRLASQYGWKSIVVVTFRPHVSRARFILRSCFDGDLAMVTSPARLSVPGWAFQYLYQTAGYVRAVLQPGC
jgi:uncharacterized SAM-binding protein YcdF (DUF218 family)